MPIPDFQLLMLPILQLSRDGEEHSLRETIEKLGARFKLSDEERKELLPSGQQYLFDNRVGWARTYLKKAGLLESTRRGYFRITEKGIKVLEENPRAVNQKYLMRFPEFRKFKDVNKKKEEVTDGSGAKKTPKELIEEGYQELKNNLSQDLLKLVKENSPIFFEKLVVELLVKMGYGGSIKDAGMAIGKTGDEGIDGIIKEDRLGLDQIYIQAKRWENPVGSGEIQKFVGALQGKWAKKGVFITTSTFSKAARNYVKQIETKVILIDKDELADFMIDFNVGVTREMLYEIKKIDTDYFEEE